MAFLLSFLGEIKPLMRHVGRCRKFLPAGSAASIFGKIMVCSELIFDKTKGSQSLVSKNILPLEIRGFSGEGFTGVSSPEMS